jgi:5-methylcytosine-specific restriction endonuclease McrA
METTIDAFRLLTNEQLLAEVRLLVARERTATAVLVASLAEVDQRKLYKGLKYPSLYKFCMEELKLSEGAAYRRIRAARVAEQFPIALNYLEDGSITLTNLTVLSRHLTLANHMTLMEAARHKTRAEVERQMAALHPDAPDLVTLRLRVRRETLDKLRRAKDLLRHVIPNGDAGEVLDRALTLLIREVERKKMAKVEHPRPARTGSRRSRYIPAAVRRAVTERDGGRCAFVGTQGRCDETAFLEFHHVNPFALNGDATVDNIQLRCRAHNQHEADQVFGGDGGSLVRERPPAYSSSTTGFV